MATAIVEEIVKRFFPIRGAPSDHPNILAFKVVKSGTLLHTHHFDLPVTRSVMEIHPYHLQRYFVYAIKDDADMYFCVVTSGAQLNLNGIDYAEEFRSAG